MVDPLVITLRSLQSAANNQNKPAQATWRALNMAGQSSGAPDIDYDRFAAQWDAEGDDGILHQMVDRFDGNGLVLKTNQPEPGQGQPKQAPSEVSKMAMSATKRGDLA
jgi:hypothetical protein